MRLMGHILSIPIRKYLQFSLYVSWPIFFIFDLENPNNLACEARGLYSSESNKKILTIQLVSLMAYILHILLRKSQQSGL